MTYRWSEFRWLGSGERATFSGSTCSRVWVGSRRYTSFLCHNIAMTFAFLYCSLTRRLCYLNNLVILTDQSICEGIFLDPVCIQKSFYYSKLISPLKGGSVTPLIFGNFNKRRVIHTASCCGALFRLNIWDLIICYSIGCIHAMIHWLC
jgi:hypothetical protein